MEDTEKVCDGCSLTAAKLKKLKKKICESLAIDRHQLLVKFPFVGNLLLRQELVPVRDQRCRTLCTDGKRIFVDISFYSKLSSKEREFVLAHELFHSILLHLTRCQTRIPDIYNIASDMEVNYCLSQQGSDLVPPKDLCWPPKSMQGKSAEVIYEWLVRKLKQQKKNGQKLQVPNGNYQKDSQSSANDDSFDDQCGLSMGDPKQCAGQGKNGKDTGNLEGQFDNHKFKSDLDPSGADNNANEFGKPGNSIKDEYGNVGYDSDFTPSISKDFADRMREAVIAEAQRCQRTKGRMPAGLEGILDALPKPEIDWRQYLASFVCSIPNGNVTWKRVNRRFLHNDMYFPSHRSEKIKVAAIVDTSGSCWGDLSKFFSELNSLLKTFGGYELTVIQCDADVHSIVKYNEENPFPVDDPKAIKVDGCGGSDFRPAFKALRKEGIENEVDAVICLTDGEIDFPSYPPAKPCLIVLTKDGNKNCCDWGKKIIFKDDSYDNSAFDE